MVNFLRPDLELGLSKETLVLGKGLVNTFTTFLHMHYAYSLLVAQLNLLITENLVPSSFSDGVMITFREPHDKP